MCLCASPIHRLQKVLSDSKEEVEILVKNYKSPAKLASFVVAMKRLILYFKQGTHTKEEQRESKSGTLSLPFAPPVMLQDGSSQLKDMYCVI